MISMLFSGNCLSKHNQAEEGGHSEGYVTVFCHIEGRVRPLQPDILRRPLAQSVNARDTSLFPARTHCVSDENFLFCSALSQVCNNRTTASVRERRSRLGPLTFGGPAMFKNATCSLLLSSTPPFFASFFPTPCFFTPRHPPHFPSPKLSLVNSRNNINCFESATC